MNEVYKLLTFKGCNSVMWDVVELSQFSVGSPTCVEFDWDKAMKQEEDFGNVVGFFHTHPFISQFASQVDCSQIDFDTMCGWVDCFGKPLYCVIGREEDDLNPTVHIFAPKNKIVLCQGSVFNCNKVNEGEWVCEDGYYKGFLRYNKPLYVKKDVLILPYLQCI